MSKVMRVVERRINGDWYVCRMWELNKDDIFRLREPTGEIVGDQNFIALSHAHMSYHDHTTPVWGIACKGEDDD